MVMVFLTIQIANVPSCLGAIVINDVYFKIKTNFCFVCYSSITPPPIWLAEGISVAVPVSHIRLYKYVAILKHRRVCSIHTTPSCGGEIKLAVTTSGMQDILNIQLQNQIFINCTENCKIDNTRQKL